MSSSYMISDTLLVNNINPFVYNMPGSRNSPYDYSVSDTMHKETPAQWEVPEESHPMCSSHLTAGDNTIGMCKNPKPNCPMHRFQEPRRLYDPGFWEYMPKKNCENSGLIPNIIENILNIDAFLLISLIVSVVVIFLVKRS